MIALEHAQQTENHQKKKKKTILQARQRTKAKPNRDRKYDKN
jgi:hypothetical protein